MYQSIVVEFLNLLGFFSVFSSRCKDGKTGELSVIYILRIL